MHVAKCIWGTSTFACSFKEADSRNPILPDDFAIVYRRLLWITCSTLTLKSFDESLKAVEKILQQTLFIT